MEFRDATIARQSSIEPKTGGATFQHAGVGFEQAGKGQESDSWRAYIMVTIADLRGDRRSRPFWALASLLLLAFLLGGGSRGDIASLIVLRPIAALLLSYGLWELKPSHVADNRFLFGIAGLIVALVLIHLVPLPPAIWSRLPGRELIVEIDNTAGLGDVWRPLSLVPSATWNAFFSLIPPLATLVLAVQLSSEEHSRLFLIIIGIGLLSVVLGMLQLGSGPGGPYYFYRETNIDSGVGLFANRNHHAVFLASLIPLLSAYASTGGASLVDYRMRIMLAFPIGLLFVVMIFVIGSRAGLLILLLAMPAALMLYRGPQGRGKISATFSRPTLWIPLIILSFIGLAILTNEFGKALAIERLIGEQSNAEMRFKAWGTVVSLVWQYFPVGSGFGTFADVFKLAEPHGLLNKAVFNHAHNDWLEVALTGGAPGCALIIVIIISIVIKIRQIRQQSHGVENLTVCLGLWIIGLFALASVSDYPVRVPSIACFCVLAAAWISSKDARSSVS